MSNPISSKVRGCRAALTDDDTLPTMLTADPTPPLMPAPAADPSSSTTEATPATGGA